MSDEIQNEEDFDIAEAAEVTEEEVSVAFDMSTLDHAQQMRVTEALIFAADTPVTLAKLQQKLGESVDVSMLVAELQQSYQGKGIELVSVAGGYAFRTAMDLAPVLKGEAAPENRKPPRAATETLAIIAYHQPVTRAEIEAIRGVQVSRGTLDILMEMGWIRPGKRRETPGRPVTWATTQEFLTHFGLTSLRDLPGVEELKAAGLLDAKPVLATIAAEPEFEGGEGVDYSDENDFLPAGDEADDSVDAIRSEDESETEVEEEESDEEYEDDSADNDNDEVEEDGGDSDDESDDEDYDDEEDYGDDDDDDGDEDDDFDDEDEDDDDDTNTKDLVAAE